MERKYQQGYGKRNFSSSAVVKRFRASCSNDDLDFNLTEENGFSLSFFFFFYLIIIIFFLLASK